MFHLKSMTNAVILISILLFLSCLDGDASRTTSYGAYISQLIRVSSHLADFNARNKSLTAKLRARVGRPQTS